MKKAAISTLITAVALSIAFAQSQPAGTTKSLSHAIHAVEDLDTTLAFYRDVFGFNGTAQNFANPAVPLLTNAPGVTLRMSMMTLPGVRFELTDFKGLERKAARAAYTDPGAGSLVFYVRDIDAAVANAKKAKAQIVTIGGTPVEIATEFTATIATGTVREIKMKGKYRSIILRDPDGFFIQLIEEQQDFIPAGAPPTGNVHRVTLAYTMESVDATKAFYTGHLGIDLTGPAAYSKDPNYAKLVGAPANIEFRKLSGALPGNSPTAIPTPIEFTEFKGLPRTKFHPRVRDFGAPALGIQVYDETATIEKMRAAGVNILSTDGKIVDFGGGTHTVFVEDPNGMNLEIFDRNPPANKK